MLAAAGGTAPAAAAHLAPRLERALATAPPGEPLRVWVFFTDKGRGPAGRWRDDLVAERSMRRRLRTGAPQALAAAADRPLQAAYVAQVAAGVHQVRRRSRWLNAVSVVATPAQIRALQRLPFVRSIDRVAGWRRQDGALDDAPPPGAAARQGAGSRPTAATGLDYGPSLPQVEMLGIPALHDSGFDGSGVLVAHFDDGMRLVTHEVFASMHVVATWDFVDNDPNPAPPAGSPGAWGAHGVATLSVLGGFAPGKLIGPAYGADFALARTEDRAAETPLEEDHWIAALEWADSLGADVVSSSLGYLVYDPPFESYTWEDLNGDTAYITRAADLAAALGIVVVTSAGNGGIALSHNTLSAPADGDSVISVGSVRADGVRSGFSSVGPTTSTPPRLKPDVMARGSSARIASTASTTSYTNSSGTSFAAPLVAGVAALLLQAKPDAVPLQIRHALRRTASRAAAPDREYGWGIVDAPAALDLLLHGVTAVEGRAPAALVLEPCVPNPFNPSTALAYRLPEASHVVLQIHDVRGRLVRTLVRRAQDTGRHVLAWNGRDEAGRGLPSGVYLVHVRATGVASGRVERQQRRAVLVR
jgi:subtilisin family serine protease